jgi:hypothetical protein
LKTEVKTAAKKQGEKETEGLRTRQSLQTWEWMTVVGDGLG